MHISDEIGADFTDMEKKLKLYVDKGRVPGAVEVREEPAISVKPEIFRIKPLEKVSSFCGVSLLLTARRGRLRGLTIGGST